MESVLQAANKSPASRLLKAGAAGMSRLPKSTPMASHIPAGSGKTVLVGKPGDRFEREADTMADRVMGSVHAAPGAAVQAGAMTPAASPAGHIHLQPVGMLQAKSMSQRMTVVPSSLVDEDKKIQRRSKARHGGMDAHHPGLPASFYHTLEGSKNGGHALSPGAAHFMKGKFNGDFHQVRIHTDSGAIKMNQLLGAEAFTHKNHIYFNSGKYEPDSASGRHLLAHELTHVVQQGYAGKAATAQPQIQPSWLSSIGDAIGAAEDFVSDTLEAGLRKFLNKASEVIQKVKGYKALRVVLGHDPITREDVPFNGHNFIGAALDLMPFGKEIGDKLNELGALQEAEQWVDTQVAAAGRLLSAIGSSIAGFIGSIHLSDLGDPVGLIERAGKLIADGIEAVTRFAGEAALELVNIIKKFLLKLLVGFIKDHTRFYPLLTVLIGHDPVTGEKVDRNGTNILTAFLLISEEGEQQKKEMEESGTFQKAAKWIDGAISTFSGAYDEIVAGIHSIWDKASMQYLIHPADTFELIFHTFAPPIGRVLAFIASTAKMILTFIKEALKKKIAIEARQHQGYPLLTVLLGEDPFTGEVVPRTVENLIHGFMSLMDGGEEQFTQMKESGAIARAEQRVNAAVDTLNMTKAYVINLFIGLWNSFSIKDLIHPLEAFARIIGTLLNPIKRLIAFVIEVIRIAVRVILEIMQFPFALIDSIMAKVVQAFETIKKDPIGFLKNLLRSIKEGFSLFFNNIGRHLLDGLRAWLSSELADAGVKAPADFSFKGILAWVLDTLNITLENIWKKIEKKIGVEKVAKIKAMLDKLDGVWSFIKDVQQRGLIAVWERIKEKLSNLWDIILDFIKGWMIKNIIEKVTAKLLSMLDPTGIMAVVNSTIALYKAIQSAIQYMRRLLEILNTFVSGILDVAKGNIQTAAAFLEKAMALGVPVMIGFLANQVGLGGIGKKVGEMIEKVREKVDTAIQWIVDKAWQIGGPLLMKIIDFAVSIGDKVSGAWDKAKAMAKAGVNKVTGLVKGLFKGSSKKSFSLGPASHTLTGKVTDGKMLITMASAEQPYATKISNALNRDIPKLKVGKTAKELNNIGKVEEGLKRALILIGYIEEDFKKEQWKPGAQGETDFNKFASKKLSAIIEQLKPFGDQAKYPYTLESLDLVFKIKKRKVPAGVNIRADLYEKLGPKSVFDSMSKAARQNFLNDIWVTAPAGTGMSVSSIHQLVSAKPAIPQDIKKANMEWDRYRSAKIIPSKEADFASPVERVNLLQFRSWTGSYAYDHKNNLGKFWCDGDFNKPDINRKTNYLETTNLRVITAEENSMKVHESDVRFGKQPTVGDDFSSDENACPKNSLTIKGIEFENGD